MCVVVCVGVGLVCGCSVVVCTGDARAWCDFCACLHVLVLVPADEPGLKSSRALSSSFEEYTYSEKNTLWPTAPGGHSATRAVSTRTAGGLPHSGGLPARDMTAAGPENPQSPFLVVFRWHLDGYLVGG